MYISTAYPSISVTFPFLLPENQIPILSEPKMGPMAWHTQVCCGAQQHSVCGMETPE